MLRYAHQLVANCVCLLFGAGQQVVYKGFLERFHRKELPSVAENNTMRAVRVNQNSKVAGQTTKINSKMLKCSVELKGTTELDSNSLWVHH